MSVGINEFVKRQTPESKFSHFEGTWQELIEEVERHFDDAVEGYRPGVMLVPVAPLRFRSSIVPITDETPLEATFGSRREFEQSHLGVVSTGGEKAPAKRVDIVLYHRDVLLEDDDAEEVGPEEWQVISINASPTEEEVPFAPIARARNILNMDGGTDAKLEEKTPEELLDLVKDMARATIFWSQHVMVEPLQAEELEVGPIELQTDGKGGGKVLINHAWEPGSSDEVSSEMDGVESLLLALACEGVKVTGPRFRRAVDTALDAIDNN